ncbi:MAG TPA: acyl carrier protein [Pseudonocardiaceae bacterium]|nr:acyl carrier protein [Pseudonocardiaceae bacterium]
MNLVDVVADVMEVDADRIADDAAPATLENWTSIRHMQLVVTLEEVYELSFSRAEIRSFTSVGEIREVLRRKGVAA